MPRRVAVIGAGPSGLATVKALLEEGHEPTCFERGTGVGGVFRFDEREGVVWESCRLTSSGLLTAFSDLPVSADQYEHMTAAEYVGYLQSYCDRFNLTGRIRFETTVESITREADDGWTVRTRDRSGAPSVERYDVVAVCSGLHQHAHVPVFPGQEDFAGKVMHGSEYRRPAQVAGKRVLVVGAGESGGDIVEEIAEAAAETVLSLRRGVAVLPRKIGGVPNDYYTTRLHYSPAHWVFQTRNPKDRRRRAVYTVLSWILLLPFKLLESMFIITGRVLRLALGVYAGRGRGKTAMRIRAARYMRQLLRESGGTGWEQFATKTENFVRAIVKGRCRRVGAIARFDQGTVVFEDGSRFDPEVVIFCTGFDVRLPFLDQAIADQPRYLQTFIPSIGTSLAFIGLVRPALGAIPPMSELQARWFALLTSGRLALPAEEEMRHDITRLADYRRDFFRAITNRLDYLVDYTWFCDELAERIGCKPTRRALRQESRRFRWRFFVGPFVAAQYRLCGPHADPPVARAVIEGLPTGYQKAAIAYWYVHWSFCRILSRVLGPRFSPRLRLSE